MNTAKIGQIRDTQLDLYRALTMIYILCIVHVGYWFRYAIEPWRSVILIEMPVIFFISGAALSLTAKHKSLKQTLQNRGRRILLPYYNFMVCILLIMCTLSLVVGGG